MQQYREPWFVMFCSVLIKQMNGMTPVKGIIPLPTRALWSCSDPAEELGDGTKTRLVKADAVDSLLIFFLLIHSELVQLFTL
jgi:hypothetical protein